MRVITSDKTVLARSLNVSLVNIGISGSGLLSLIINFKVSES